MNSTLLRSARDMPQCVADKTLRSFGGMTCIDAMIALALKPRPQEQLELLAQRAPHGLVFKI